MKINQIFSNIAMTMAFVAIFAPVPAQAVALAQENKIEGVIVSRDGDNLVMRSDAGAVTNVSVTKSTKIDMTKGLIGVRSDDVTSAILLPGLRISVEPESPGKETTAAKSIQFHANDLETAKEIQAALTVPQQQIQMLIEKVKAQELELAAQKQQNESQDQMIAAVKADSDKRFSELADYDVKAELTVLFDVNSANLTDKAKEDLKTIAAKAKSFKGYLVQVAGFADSTGSASVNQDLSDRRAESVASFLRQSCDLGMSRVLAPVAMSTAKPVAPNETAQGKAENRRVTVKVAVNRGIAQ